MPNLIFVKVAIMTLYVKGFKIDRQKVADVVEARDRIDPLVDTGIQVIVSTQSLRIHEHCNGLRTPKS